MDDEHPHTPVTKVQFDVLCVMNALSSALRNRFHAGLKRAFDCLSLRRSSHIEEKQEITTMDIRLQSDVYYDMKSPKALDMISL